MEYAPIHLQAGLNRVVFTDTEIEGEPYSGTQVPDSTHIFSKNGEKYIHLGTLGELKDKNAGTRVVRTYDNILLGDVAKLTHSLYAGEGFNMGGKRKSRRTRKSMKNRKGKSRKNRGKSIRRR